MEVVSLVGSLLCFPEILPRLPVLQANPNELNLVTCDQVKVNVSMTINRSAVTYFMFVVIRRITSWPW